MKRKRVAFFLVATILATSMPVDSLSAIAGDYEYEDISQTDGSDEDVTDENEVTEVEEMDNKAFQEEMQIGDGEKTEEFSDDVDQQAVSRDASYSNADEHTVEITDQIFPDENFRNYISENLDNNSDGKLSENEITSVTELNISEKNIADLAGINNFGNLITLNCSRNHLNKLNLEENDQIINLDCSNNELERLELGSRNIQVLHCENNHLFDISLPKVFTINMEDEEQKTVIGLNPQTVKMNATKISDSLWEIDFSKYVGKENIGNISNIQLPEKMVNPEIDENGMLQFSVEDKKTESFSYDYLVKDLETELSMNVTVEVLYNDNLFEEQTEIDCTEIASNADDLIYGDYKYSLYNNEVTITGYTGTESSITIPSKIDIFYVKKIGIGAFRGCETLVDVVVPKGVETINWQAFSGCRSLKTITLPEGLKAIGYAFIEDTSVTSLTIPNSVEELIYDHSGPDYYGQGAVSGAEYLEKIIFENGMDKIPDYFCTNREANSSIKQIVFPESITEIGKAAFRNCTGIEYINLGGLLNTVGERAFESCYSLKQIEFQENSEDTVIIKDYAFSHCTSLSRITLPENLVNLCSYVFENCDSLAEIILPDQLKYIGPFAFFSCTNLKEIILPESLEKLGNSFIANTAITSLKIPKSLKWVDCGGTLPAVGVTNGAVNLQEIVFEDGMEVIPDYICSNYWENTILGNIVIPKSVTEIGTGAFYNCAGIEKIKFGKAVNKVGNDAFGNCGGLIQIEFQNNELIVTDGNGSQKLYPVTIGARAFNNCSCLSNIILSVNIASIGPSAFANCVSLTEIVLPNSIEDLGTSFIKNTMVTSLTIPKSVKKVTAGNTQTGVVSGALFLKEIIFEEGTEYISDYFCANSPVLEKAVIPKSVIGIGSHAFYNCPELMIYGKKRTYAEQYAEDHNIPFYDIVIGTVTRYDTAKNVLDKFPADSLLNNIELSNGKIYGPQITILGKTIRLFEIDAGMSLPFKDKVQAKVDLETKTVQVLIGFKDFSGSASLDQNSNSTKYWSESYRQVKNIYTGMTGKKVDSTKLWNDFSRLRGKLKAMHMTMAIDANASAAGYMEFSYASGEFKFQEGGIILETGIGAELNHRFEAFPAAYVAIKINGDFKGNLSLVKSAELNYSLSLMSQIELALRLGIGLGIKQINQYLEGGLTGSLTTKISLPASSLEDALTVLITGGLYIEWQLLGFPKGSKEEEFKKQQIYPQKEQVQAFDGMDVLSLDEANASGTEREYLNSSDHETMLSGNDAIQGSVFEKDGTYPYCSPEYVELNDETKVMVWIDDDGTKSAVNRTSLFASVCKKGQWSEAKALYETGGLNDYPDMYSDGEKVYIVWQRTAEPLAQDAVLSDAMKAVNLYCITYADGEFSEPELVGNNDNLAYEMMHKVAASGSETAVVWVENSVNDPFMNEGTNSIKVAYKQKEEWIEETVADGLSVVSNVELDYINRNLAVSYEIYSEDENKIYLEYKGKVKEFSGSNSTMDDGILYYTKAGKMNAYDINSDSAMDDSYVDLDNFSVVSGSGIKYLLTLQSSGLTNELYASVYDEDNHTWGNPVAVTDYGKYIRSYSAEIDKSDNLTIAMNVVNVDEKSERFTDQADIYVVQTGTVKDIAISNLTYDDNLVKAGQNLPLDFKVTNNSLVPVKTFRVTLTDENGKQIDSGKVSSDIEPGDSREVSYIYPLPQTISLHTVHVSVEADDEINKKDNSGSVTIGYGNLVLENLHLTGSKEKPFVSGMVSNCGYDDLKNIVVSVYENNVSGQLLGTFKTNTLTVDEQTEFSIEIPAEMMNVAEEAIGNVVYVNVETDSIESNVADNSDYLLIDGENIKNISLNYNKAKLQVGEKVNLKVAYTGDSSTSTATAEWKSSNTNVAKVTSGIVTAVGAGTAVITVTLNSVYARCKITVTDTIEVNSITMKKQSVRILEGEQAKLEATVLPENATNKNINWSSSDENIAVVDQSGNVTGIKAGTATVTATAEDGEKKVDCTVSVIKDKTIEYKVTFASNKAEGTAPDEMRATGGSKITLPGNPFHREGYQFTGWNDGKKIYQEKDIYRMPFENVTFTAQWQPISTKKDRSIKGVTDFQKKDGDPVFNLNAVLSEGDGKLEYSSDNANVIVDTKGNVTIQRTGVSIITILAPENNEYRETRKEIKITIEHSWGEWKMVSQSDGTDNNQEIRECLFCGKKEYRKGEIVSPTPTAEPTIPSATPAPTPELPTPDEVTPTPVLPIPGEVTPTLVQPTPNVNVLKKGDVFKVKTSQYKVTGINTVAYIGTTDSKAKKISVGSTVLYSGVTYKITAISTKALKNHKKVTQIVVGNNVTTIGTSAFEGCKMLKKVTLGNQVTVIGSKAFRNCGKLSALTVKSKKLKKAGSNAFKGISSSAKIKVPAAKLRTYKKLLKSKGQGKNVKIMK